MARIFLVSRDWHLRALLRAQLLEEGLEVKAFEESGSALAGLETAEEFPTLLVADLSSADNPEREAELLSYWANQFPIWVISSHMLAGDADLTGPGFERILSRPIDLGEFVEDVKHRVL
jgi:DNA-binding NtrC family response regulator